ncbi:MAG: YheU family protein [Spongiibacteraceae bacterium]
MNDFVEIPWQKLSTEALEGMLEELVSRDGTDYGEQEVTVEEKTDQLLTALKEGRATVMFCPETGTWSVIEK